MEATIETALYRLRDRMQRLSEVRIEMLTLRESTALANAEEEFLHVADAIISRVTKGADHA